MILCLDSSVLCKLLRSEDGSDETMSIIESYAVGEVDLKASNLVTSEIGNFLWKMDRKGVALSKESFDHFFSIGIELIPDTPDVCRKSLSLSKASGMTFYDAIHVVVSRENRCPLVTQDKKILAECEDAITIEEALEMIRGQDDPAMKAGTPSSHSSPEL